MRASVIASGFGRGVSRGLGTVFGRLKPSRAATQRQRMIEPQIGARASIGASAAAPAGPRIEPMLMPAPSMPRPAARSCGVVASVIAAIEAGCRPGDRRPNHRRTKTSRRISDRPEISPLRPASSANRKAMLVRPMAQREKTITRLRPTRSAIRPHCGIMTA